ncbi:MAG: hypothetical protein A3I73_06115 [Omnitrophica bacterium RIFCSPLOWO2_02_FULL_45_16]|nr:MAG: hypothetical protein A3C51_01820 [Omnitrophica bacterium RIFCSPHIGHO2_02_FULL_46_20]OGW93216.1 MAG: hypothetical protein A3G36_00675 [Omnitrophica bacterium RIFCSPLOWO2_12_FULL_45_13]OGW94966.1 MAG: hypothetical protein A3K16_02565 [Omnitrophica bacterium RIFCSPLOWO2_01_FULL_45_24]OGX01127.1 MAG: hypothetical protein A3I73_06115 [Omnitrophica bacterium RIFCSPLOWO2_02_FULL_45_16]
MSGMNRVNRKLLLGLGLDCKDGHVRVTKGKNFALFGGSEETHEMMQEKAVKFNEQLDKRRKSLDNLSEKEFCDIAKNVGLRIRKNREE